MALESGGLWAAPLPLPSRAVRAAPTLSQLRLLGFRVPKFFSWAAADCRRDASLDGFLTRRKFIRVQDCRPRFDFRESSRVCSDGSIYSYLRPVLPMLNLLKRLRRKRCKLREFCDGSIYFFRVPAENVQGAPIEENVGS